MDIKECRERIDAVDEQLVKLFEERMRISDDIARYKQANGLPISDPERERKKLYDVSGKLPEELRQQGTALYSLLFDLSKSRQSTILGNRSSLVGRIQDAIENTPKSFPERAAVACQGVEGAYSQIACCRMFQLPDISYLDSFEGVFAAVEAGFCDYGVVPLENSTAGSVNAVYDLMMKHNFSIVKSVRIKIDHCLLAKRGTKLSDIKEIYSHEQAISQSRAFLSELPGVKLTPVSNTAVAAQMVAGSERRDVAALSSHACAELYGLECLSETVQDQGNNYTRFICISKNLEIYPGADRTSLMMVLPHKPGALYKTLSRFYALGINLNKLESRPIPSRNFEFMFYFDLENSVYQPQFSQMIGELSEMSEEFAYLGSYSEVV